MHLTFSSYIISLLGVALRSDRLAVADLHDVDCTNKFVPPMSMSASIFNPIMSFRYGTTAAVSAVASVGASAV